MTIVLTLRLTIATYSGNNAHGDQNWLIGASGRQLSLRGRSAKVALSIIATWLLRSGGCAAKTLGASRNNNNNNKETQMKKNKERDMEHGKRHLASAVAIGILVWLTGATA